MPGRNIELIPDPKEGGFTARLPDTPAYGEGETEEAAIADFKEALKTYIEAFGLEDALSRVNTPTARAHGGASPQRPAVSVLLPTPGSKAPKCPP